MSERSQVLHPVDRRRVEESKHLRGRALCRWLGGLVVLLGLVGSHAALAESETVPRLEWPGVGETVSIEVVPGQQLALDIAPESANVLRDGDDLVLVTSGREPEEAASLVLSGYFAIEPPASLILEDGTAIDRDTVSASLAALDVDALGASTLEPAAGPSFLSGVPILRWFAQRSNVGIDIQAAASPAAGVADSRQGVLLERGSRYLAVVHARAVLSAAQDFDKRATALVTEIQERANSGVGSHADLLLAQAWLGTARLQSNRARGEWLIALDAYQAGYALRPAELREYPRGWQARMPAGLDELASALGSDAAPRVTATWRRMDSAERAMDLHDARLRGFQGAREAYLRRFAVGQAGVESVLSLDQAVFDATVERAANEYALHATRAAVLAALGRLRESDLELPSGGASESP